MLQNKFDLFPLGRKILTEYPQRFLKTREGFRPSALFVKGSSKHVQRESRLRVVRAVHLRVQFDRFPRQLFRLGKLPLTKLCCREPVHDSGYSAALTLAGGSCKCQRLLPNLLRVDRIVREEELL